MFVELFAGIGGFRLGLEDLGGRCALAVELDPGARMCYAANFGDEECATDVLALDAADIPIHDILTAGFPCQPYAQCNMDNLLRTGSLQAGLGLREARGVLALEVVRILRVSQPRALLLENVPNLLEFNGGADFRELMDALSNAGYTVQARVLDAMAFGVPQQRRRLYFVGFRNDIHEAAFATFKWPDVNVSAPRLLQILEPREDIPASCYLPQKTWSTMLAGSPDIWKQSGCGGRVARLDGYARTLCSSYRTAGGHFSEFIPTTSLEDDASAVEGPPQAPPRFLTQRECCRLMGFPDTYSIDIANRHYRRSDRFYHYIGNAVVPHVIRAIGANMLGALP